MKNDKTSYQVAEEFEYQESQRNLLTAENVVKNSSVNKPFEISVTKRNNRQVGSSVDYNSHNELDEDTLSAMK